MRRLALCLGALSLVAAIGLPSPAARADGDEEPRASRPRPFLKLESGRRVSTAPDKGGTFHARERRAYEVTTFYRDMTAVATRSTDGRIAAAVTGQSAALRIEASVASDSDAGFLLTVNGKAGTLLFRGRSDLVPTLDWANRQTVSLLGATDPVRIRWSHDLLVPSGGSDSAAAEILGVRTRWPGGMVAEARVHERYAETTLTRSEQALGIVRWYPAEQVLAWKFPGLAEGALDDESQARIGGWPFTPDMAWMNVQALAFFEYASARRAPRMNVPEGIRSAFEFFSPPLLAQDGCTGLHWLDGTTYRECCDIHDQCYVKNGCSSDSWWWPFGSAWQCTACNGGAVFCFSAKQLTPWVY